jgi:bla regulator protein BlaR1
MHLIQSTDASQAASFVQGIHLWMRPLTIGLLISLLSGCAGWRKQAESPPPPAIDYVLQTDQNILGTWKAIDFVNHPQDFDPARRNWKGDLSLKELIFSKDGAVQSAYEKPTKQKHRWAAGKVDPQEERPAYYYLREIDGRTFLFLEWISGDVTLRGMVPKYYVLRRVN